MKYWQTARRKISLDRPLVMGILNVTPDSFSDGGRFASIDAAVRQAEQMISDGADIIDIGGESTRPGSAAVKLEEEIKRTIPIVEQLAKRFDPPISIDTTKSDVAGAAIDAGAEIINDISALRFDEDIAEVAAGTGAGLVLMHSRGGFETMHSQPPVADIRSEVIDDLKRAITLSESHSVRSDHIVLDIGLGFGKTYEQNLELLADLGKIIDEFGNYPILVGASRKSFIGKILGNVPPVERVGGSVAAALIAIRNGAHIVRVHDVKETVQAIKVTSAISEFSKTP